MAPNLSPELLKILLEGKFDPASYLTQMGKKTSSFGMNPDGTNVKGYFDAATNRNYAPVYSGSGVSDSSDGSPGTLVGYNSFDPKGDVKDATNYMFDTKGNSTGDFKSNDFLTMEPGEMIALLGIMAMTGGAAASAMAPAGAGVAGGVGSAGTGLAGDAFLPGMLAASEGAPIAYGSILPGLEGVSSSLISGGFNAAADSQLANLGIEAAGGNPLAGYAGTGGVTASPVGGGGLLSGLGDKASSLVSSLTGGKGGTDLMGLATTALGALGGSQGQKGENSSTRMMDPRLDQPVFGDLIPRTQNKLNELMTPERMMGYRNMQTMGNNLLSRPVAGNDFERFYGGR